MHTHHASLHWLLIISDPSGRLIRWRLRLAEFEFEVKYKKVRKNQQADALSSVIKNSETVREDDGDKLFTLDPISLTNHE